MEGEKGDSQRTRFAEERGTRREENLRFKRRMRKREMKVSFVRFEKESKQSERGEGIVKAKEGGRRGWKGYQVQER